MSDNKENLFNAEDEEEFDVVSLVDEEGKETEFAILDIVKYEDESYCVLMPIDEDKIENEDENESEEDSVIILKIEKSDDPDSESYVPVDDDEIEQKVFDLFLENNKDLFDISEDED